MSGHDTAVQPTWWDSQAPSTGAPPRFDPDAPPARIADRYEVRGLLGRGGPGTVWRCWDLLENEEVAIKVLSALTERQLANVRRETVALRWARLPGVVRLRDELRIGDDWFLVMDLVPGRAFPGGDGPVPWASLEPFARRLLEILGTLHDAGVVHGDLKPTNVFILPARLDVVLLDLGMATGRSVVAARSGLTFAGTPAYAAPEQLGGVVDHRTDLFAVGVMLYYALTGEIPLYDPAPLVMVSRRARDASPSLAGRLPELPPTVVALVDALLAAKPQDRPESAWLALERIGGRAPAPLSGDLVLPEGRLDDAALRALVHGPDAFLHLREDTARVLYARTGGHPADVREELAAWLRAGLGRWEDGALRIERPAIARLEAGEALVPGPAIEGESADLRLLIGMAHPFATVEALSAALGRDVREEVEGLIARGLVWPVGEALGSRPVRALGRPEAALLRRIAESMRPTDPARVELLFRGGAGLGELVEAIEGVLGGGSVVPERMLALLEPHLARARVEGDPQRTLWLLTQRTCFALAMAAPAPAEQVLFEIQRALAEGSAEATARSSLQSLEGLVKAALAFLSGDLAGARSQVEGLPALEEDELESWRCGILVELARQRGAEAWGGCLEGLRGWAERSSERQARYEGWWGNRLYALGQYAEAARAHERAAAGKSSLAGRVSSMRNAASAWMEAGEYGLAAILAEQVAELSREARIPRLEANAVWCARGAHARAGQTMVPSITLVKAAFQVERQTGAMMALGEACIAWRAHDRRLASDLAQQALPEFRNRGVASGVVLAWLLDLLGRTNPDLMEVEDLLLLARSKAALGVRLQAYGLLGIRTGRPDLLVEARALADRWGRDNPNQDLELGHVSRLACL